MYEPQHGEDGEVFEEAEGGGRGGGGGVRRVERLKTNTMSVHHFISLIEQTSNNIHIIAIMNHIIIYYMC